MTPSILDKLQMEITNLFCIPDENKYPKYSVQYFAYKEGHREARHAAVEVLLKYAKQFENE